MDTELLPAEPVVQSAAKDDEGAQGATCRSSRRQRRFVICGLALLLAAWLLAAFDEDVDAQSHVISPNVAHPFDPDWLEVRWIMNTKCVACHRANSERADFSTHAALMAERDGMPLIKPGEPEESWIWQYCAWNVRAELDSPHADTPMMPPQEDEWLSDGQLEVLSRWIARGAPEYKSPAYGPATERPLLEIDFPSARECKTCHPKQYEEWSRSMHAYAMQSPAMEAFNLTLVERTEGTVGTFCTRCHTPLGTAIGEDGTLNTIHRSQLSQEGVTCVVCHRVQQPYFKANTRHAIQPGGVFEGCMFGPFDDHVSAQEGAHDSSGRPFLKRSEFCGSCHDVTNPAGVRLEEAFSEWRNSPAATDGVTCQACHMGPVAGKPIPDDHRPLGRAAVVPGVDPERIPLRHLSDHTFAGPDYSLLPDTEFPHKLDWMYEVDYRNFESLTPYQQKTLIDLRKKNRKQLEIADAKRYELLRNGARLSVAAPRDIACGDSVPVRATVQSTFAGHNYPTGFSAERQLWVQVIVRDQNGRTIYASGDLDSNGDLRDDHSYEVQTGAARHDRDLMNFQSKFIALTNRGTERSVVLAVNRHLTPISLFRPATDAAASFGRPGSFRIQKSSLPPFGKASNTYRFAVPQAGDYLLQVKLLFRHLPPKLLDEIGIPHLKPQLEAVVVDEFESVIHARPR
ncbi:MAG: hypothetical protein MPJ50_09095 [Pirellulales bacterium]|nr:hypothetical protein [Pirellulales bacterium]